ncbi:MAG: riboflavin synthase [Candidatus Margulisiibacteriota bacterium]
MFTGLIEEIGVIAALVRNGRALRMGVHAKKVILGLKVGDSITVNGVCLSVVEMGRTHFVVEAVEETLKKSSLGSLRLGDKVNLERALLLTARLGGHIMTGHIDGVAEIKGILKKDEGFELVLTVSPHLRRYIVPQGSIGIDGVSLTVARITAEGVHLMVIPITAQQTSLGAKNIGDRVNLEVDILSKYIENFIQGGDAPPSPAEKMMLTSGFFPMGIWDN